MAVSITTTAGPLPPATFGSAYSFTFAATGGVSYTWSVVSGHLPPGLSLTASTGILTGTPNGADGTYTFVVKVTSGSSSDQANYQLTSSTNLSSAPDWAYPETWNVGDRLDAETMNRRVRDQNTILLRRPMLVAHTTASQTVATAVDTMLSWNTIDEDDDGWAAAGTPATRFYCQRDGTYQFWLNVTGQGNGVSGTTFQTSFWINDIRRWDVQTTFTPTSGKQFAHSTTGLIALVAGDNIKCGAWQNTTANVTVPVVANSPRFAIMWLGIT
jgi:hypothetical protein